MWLGLRGGLRPMLPRGRPGSWSILIWRLDWMISECRRVIVFTLCQVPEKGSTRYRSMPSGASASALRMETLMTLKFAITIEARS